MPPVLFVTLISDMARPTGYRTRVLAEMETLRDAGVSVQLLALSPIGLVARPEARRAFQRELRGRGLTGALAPHPPSLRTRIGRVVMLRAASAWVALVARRTGARVVHAHGPYATAVALSARAGRRLPAVVYDAHGLGLTTEELVLNAQVTGMSARRLAWEERLVRDVERRSWREADGVVAVSHALIEQLGRRYGPRSARTLRVPCAATPSAYVGEAARAQVRQQFGLDGRAVLVYTGSLAPYQRAPGMIELAAALHALRPSVFLLIVSQAPAQQWHALADRSRLPAEAYQVVEGVGARVAELTSAGDLGLMLRDATAINYVAFPTKLAEYLAAGVPVLTTSGVCDPADLVRRERVGLVSDGDAITAQAVLGALDNVCAERAAWAARCRAVADGVLSWRQYKAPLLELYASIAGCP